MQPLKKPFSPRVRLAHTLYATGAVRTKKEAAAVVGLAPQYLYMIRGQHTEEVQETIDTAQYQIAQRATDMSAALDFYSRRAVDKIAQLMDTAAKEDVQLRAAQDLADRGPHTAKIQRHAIANLTMSAEDAKAIAAAMVESASVREQTEDVVSGSYVKIKLHGMDGEVPNGDGGLEAQPGGAP